MGAADTMGTPRCRVQRCRLDRTRPARSLLADDLHFQGPIDTFNRADDFVKTISELYGMVKGVEQQATIAQGDDAAYFYLLDTPVAKAPIAEWHRVQDGKIVKIRAYFDARPFAAH